MTHPGADPWHGTHPDTEAGKPTTTDPQESANHTPTKAATPTTEKPTTPPDDTTAGQNEWQPSTERPTQHVIQDIRIGTEPATKPAQAEPESATPDTDSANSDDPNTTTPDYSNHLENTDPSPSDASDASHSSATGDLSA